MIGDPANLVVRTGFPRLSAAEIAPFRERSTSFDVDAVDGRGALDHAIEPLDPNSRQRAHGAACARDNLAALAARELIEPGDVLAIAAQGFCGTATRRQHGQDRAAARRRRRRDRRPRPAAEIVELGIPVFVSAVPRHLSDPRGPLHPLPQQTDDRRRSAESPGVRLSIRSA